MFFNAIPEVLVLVRPVWNEHYWPRRCASRQEACLPLRQEYPSPFSYVYGVILEQFWSYRG